MSDVRVVPRGLLPSTQLHQHHLTLPSLVGLQLVVLQYTAMLVVRKIVGDYPSLYL
jgi:hypothetical protein